MTTYDRWFLTPAKTFERTDNNGDIIEEYTAPKYHETDGITGFSGNTTTPDVINDHYPALIQTHPDVSEWYIVRMYGEDSAGWSALNEIHTHGDTRTLADHANDVAPVLNGHFPDLERSGSEWAKSFKIYD